MKFIHKLIVAQILITSTLQVYYIRKICISADLVSEKITLCNRANEERFESIKNKVKYLKDLMSRNEAQIDLLKIQNETDSVYNQRIDLLHQTVQEINIRIKEK